MLPYDAEALLAFQAALNRALWPAQIAVLIIATIALLAALRPPGAGALADPRRGRDIAAILAIAWGWVGGGFFIGYFAELDFMAPAYGALFLLQAGLLLWAAVASPPTFRFRGGPFSQAGLVLAVLALVVLPLAGPAFGAGWDSAAMVGLAPGPTALFTLGLLLLAGGRGRPELGVAPLIWSLVAGFQGWVLGLPQHLVLAALCLLAFALLIPKHLRGRS